MRSGSSSINSASASAASSAATGLDPSVAASSAPPSRPASQPASLPSSSLPLQSRGQNHSIRGTYVASQSVQSQTPSTSPMSNRTALAALPVPGSWRASMGSGVGGSAGTGSAAAPSLPASLPGTSPTAPSQASPGRWRSSLDAASGATGVSMPFDDGTRTAARQVYEESRHYHGTGDVSKQSIRLHGFSNEHKTHGGSAAVRSHYRSSFDGENAPPPQATSYHYLTAAKSQASRYALKASSGRPSLVRTIDVPHAVQMERVMGADRTSSDIPPQHVLGSKMSDPGLEGSVFQQALERAGIQVSEQAASLLLRDVQSDSEHDFSASSSDDER